VRNFELGERLLRQAEESLEDMERAFQRGSWNMVMRRGQEVVELALKGLLSAMAVEYPKVHDVALPFVKMAQESTFRLRPHSRTK
jgi:HEPN domain-containing protein